jgi:hypothetical protein
LARVIATYSTRISSAVCSRLTRWERITRASVSP